MLRKWLLVALGVALIGWATAAIVHHHKAATETAAVAPTSPVPKTEATKPPSSAQPETASTAPSTPSSATERLSASALRSAPGGEAALILAAPALAPSPAAQVALPPQIGSSPAKAVPDLPTVAVAPPNFHVVPNDRDTKAFGAVTMSDHNGRTFTIVPAAPMPASSPSPQRTASVAPPAASPAPRPEVFAPVGNPAVFSGRARVTGPFTLDVEGQAVRLFGITLPPTGDRCAASNGTVKPCAAVAEATLTQKLAGHSIVACRVPPGQRGTLGAICLDEQGNDLGRYLVIEGLALADSNQSYDYLPAQGAARSAKRGLWHFR
ncbi:MAG TPA: thermonuclease family protein [Stellaceae bacterium]|nr:thermonuclease family protein [Stellaceae bacterium]